MLGDISEDFGYYILYTTSGSGNTGLALANIEYNGVENLSVRAGHFKVPFGRMYNASGLRLIFKSRNPINSYFGPGDGTGIAAKYSLLDGMLDAEAGVFNGEGLFTGNSDTNLDFSGYISFAPWGQIPLHESAHMGYDEMKLAIMPGFALESQDVPGEDDPRKLTKYGVHTAFRMNTLALDALLYMSSLDIPGIEDPIKAMGYSLQGGYTVGKFEPVVRFTIIDPNTDADDNAATLGQNSTTTIEAGVNYYIKGYSSRLGLNFSTSSVAEDNDDTMKSTTLDIYYELFF